MKIFMHTDIRFRVMTCFFMGTILFAGIVLSGCETFLDTKKDVNLTTQDIQSNYKRLWDFGYASYMRLINGFYPIDNNLFAAVSDEAEFTLSSSQTQLFNEGSWNAVNNPNNVYYYYYEGIRATNFFLSISTDYKRQLYHNVDTLSDNGLQYRNDVLDIQWLRAENRVLRAYYYFELFKRFGDVPLITRVLEPGQNTNIPRTPVQDMIDFIVSEIDAVTDSLQTNWKTYDNARDGRFTKGAAMALKSRTLLYAASSLFNPTNDVTRWEDAARAAHDVLALNQYTLDTDYRQLFLGDYTVKSPEVIFAIRQGASNDLERSNYPINTPGGGSGITPSHNLVSAYEYNGTPDAQDPYVNRDPRMAMSVVVNNSEWNGRCIQIHKGGQDDYSKSNVSRTGYYLKKFLNDNLNLVRDEKKQRSWIMFRLAELYLNYAEAMNEAYGPDDAHGYTLTALQALNMVRNRPGVKMPPVVTTDKNEFRARVKQERRIELAFEDHRYWDLKRWKDAEVELNKPLLGIRAANLGNQKFLYTEFEVEKRIFEPKMYLYPIPQLEITKSEGVIKQNEGW